MYIDMDDKSVIDLGKVINEFKNILDNLMEKFSNLNLKKQHSVEDLVEKYSADDEFLKKLDIINSLMRDISDKLESLSCFENEFHNFLSIQNMITYITGDIERYIRYSSFVKELTSSFCELINAKINLFKNNEHERYAEIYKSFDDDLFEYEEFFYLNIYEPTNQFDDLIDKITNILWC